ncbi:MAG: SprT family zinc-dependent metalloprotease [Deltaproteobacteria bacterium]
MNTERHKITVSGIPVEVVRKDIKNLHLGVYPPNGRVRVAAPTRLTDEAIRLAVVTRLGWIRRKKAYFEKQERQSAREMVTGESHYYQGRRYLLDVIKEDKPPSVQIRNKTTLELRVRPGSDRAKRKQVLHGWYRGNLREQVSELVAEWEPIIGVSVSETRIKRMRTRWGTCNITARRIWVNLELAKKPPSCLEFIVVHEGDKKSLFRGRYIVEKGLWVKRNVTAGYGGRGKAPQGGL